jgi:imidazoleglycerol-phosphate dehydratase
LSASKPDEELRVRVGVAGRGRGAVETGIPVLDHLLGLLARYASLDITLEVAPGSATAESAAAGTALGEAVAPHLRAEGARGWGSATVPSREAIAHVALERADEPKVFSNVDLSEARVGGLAPDVIGDFLESLAGGAGLILHVRLLEGDDPEHVLETVFKSLGAALAHACEAPQRGGS